MCIKYNRKMPALAAPPMPGEKGKFIYENVSQQAWQEWLNHQTMLINEKRLALFKPEDRLYLETQMEKFINNEDFDKPAGYVPPTK